MKTTVAPTATAQVRPASPPMGLAALPKPAPPRLSLAGISRAPLRQMVIEQIG